MPNILADIELSEKQIKAFNEELDVWKEKTRKKIEEEVRSEIKTEYDVKLREIKEEKEKFKEEQGNLVEQIKDKMQKVLVKRFTNAMKETYDQLKVEARKDVLNDPRILALEEVKNVVYPLMDETVTKGYVDELANALKMVESKDDENDKLRAKLKLKEIVSTLSPQVAEAVETFIGEANSEEEVVEKYAKLKNLVSEGKKKAKDDDEDEEDDYDEEEEEEGEEPDEDEDDEDMEESVNEEGDGDAADYAKYGGKSYKEKKKTLKKKRSKDDDEEDEEDEVDEDLEIQPKVHFDRNEKKNDEYVNQLNEMLDLAGIPKD
jgi:hypothetical protein